MSFIKPGPDPTLLPREPRLKTLLQHPQPQIRQLRNAVTAASSLQGLYPPAGFAKAAKDMNMLWTSIELLSEDSLQQVLHANIVKETELLHSAQDIIYTDGSKREMHTFGTVTGSGVYRQAPAAALQLKVHPIGQGMLNTINRAELVAILVALQECRPYEDECIATDSRCSMQKINKHLRAPAQTKDDCHRPLLQAITKLIVERAKTGLTTKIMKVKSHKGIHGNEMADKLANEAAEECTKARQFDRDVLQEYCEPFKDKFWIQHEIQVPTTTGTSKKLESLRDLHNNLSQKVHAKYKLGSSNQDSIYFQLWKNLQPYRDQKHSDKFRTMRCFSIDKLRWGKTWTKKAAFMQHRPYLPGQPIATNSKCPLPGCQGNDCAGHILLECMHADMKKQHIARHDAMMRMLIKEFTIGTKGSHYLIADVGTVDALKDLGAHCHVVTVVSDRYRAKTGYQTRRIHLLLTYFGQLVATLHAQQAGTQVCAAKFSHSAHNTQH